METTLDLEELAQKASAAAELLRALSSGPRLLVLCHLAAAGELPVNDLVSHIGLSQSALSQHLAKLREQGLVAYRREGQSLYYSVVDPKALRLLQTLQELFCPELRRQP